MGKRGPGGVGLAVTCLMSLAAGAVSPAAGVAQEPPDTGRVVPVTPLEVTVLRGPVVEGRAPYAVSVLGAAQMREGKSGVFLEEALAGLPGVQVQNRYNFAGAERITVRGFGARAQFGIRGVRILVDGIPATMPDGQSSLDHLDLSTLGRAEILRGPGSALYGNAAGGVLTFHSQPPSERPHHQVRVVGGGDGLLNLSASSSMTVESTGVLLGVSHLDFDGFRDDPTRDGHVYGVTRRQVLNGQLTRPLGPGTLTVTANALSLDAESAGSLNAAALAAGSRSAWASNVTQRTRDEIVQLQGGAAWRGVLGGAMGEVAVWGIRRSLLGYIPPTIIDLDRAAGGLRVLLNGSARQGRLQWGAGAEVEFQRDDRLNYANDEGEADALTLDQLETVRSTGAFLHGGLDLGSRVRAGATARYDRFRFEAEDRFTGPTDPDDSGVRTMDRVSPTLGVTVDVGSEAVAWANVSSSLETPATTELVNRPDGAGGFNPELEPQTTTGFELGIRGRGGDRFSWELALFRAELRDALVAFEVEGQAGRVFFRNAGEVRHEGAEALLRAVLGRGLAAQLTVSRLDARFQDFLEGGSDFSGNRVPGVAPHRVEALVSHEGHRWYWALEGTWTDRVPANDGNTERSEAYALLDVRAGLRRVGLASLDLAPFGGVNNVLDETYAASLVVNAFGGRFYEPGPARSVYLGMSVTWRR